MSINVNFKGRAIPRKRTTDSVQTQDDGSYAYLLKKRVRDNEDRLIKQQSKQL